MIVTNYIDGRKVNLKPGYTNVKCKKWEYVVDDDRELCDNTLTSLNLLAIEHGDARTSNFVIVGNKAIILDFGFSKKENIKNENLKDDEIVKSNNFT